MDFLAEGLRRAFALIVRGDTEVYGIALLTFKVALTATVVACGHVSAEIGSAMIVGGNIRGQTRTLTTAVALYTEQGDFGLALALCIILLLLALMVNVGLQALQGRGGAGGSGARGPGRA